MTWVGVGVAVVGTGVSAYQANKANKAQNRQGNIADRQAQLAEAIYADSGPLRETSQASLFDFLNRGQLPYPIEPGFDEAKDYGLNRFAETGDLPVAVQPRGGPVAPRITPYAPVARPKVADMTAYDRDVLEKQFAQARGNLYANSPNASGALEANLGELESERALGVTDIYSKQNRLQYEADLAEAQRMDEYMQAAYDARMQAELLDYGMARDQHTQDAALRRGLFGSAVDIEQQNAMRNKDLRKALFASALGLGSQDAGLALGGLSGASQSYGNVASSALAGTGMAMDATSTALGYGIRGLVKRQNPRNSGEGTTDLEALY